MHMADALLSPTVALAMNAVSIAAIGVSVAKVKKEELAEKIIPVMGIAGALVFAGQMINFTIPATGSSGHIGGGILLAGLLGGVPAFLSITAVLIIQCLFFADGGLLALGCNIFNMGVIPCLIAYPLIFKTLIKRGIDNKSLSIASIAAVIIGLELGAFCVVLQTLLSGITKLPFGTFTALMLSIHSVIGFAEGIITAAILCFIYKMRPEIIDSAQSGEQFSGGSMKNAFVALVLLIVIVGGGLSLFASSNPDGLEWSMAKTSKQTIGVETELDAEGTIFEIAAITQKSTAFLPGYAFASNPQNPAGTSVSGLIGATVTFLLAGMTGLVISLMKKDRKLRANV